MAQSFWAPGRVNLIGEHTDHTGGLVLPAAIDLGVRVTVEPADKIALVSAGIAVELAADGAGESEGWGRFVAAVAAELDGLGRPAVGVAGTVEADLPRGAGLGASAALEVAVALALCGVADFEVDPFELVLACQRAEHRAVGVPSGILDQAASLLARAGHALLLDCSTHDCRQVALPYGLALLVFDSGDRHAHELSGYAARRRELEAALPGLAGRRPSEVAPDELSEEPTGIPARRLRHVVTENARVSEVVAALERADLGKLGPLFAASHASLRDDYEVSTPAIDRLVELALASGALAARLTGGGFGGSIVALAEHEWASRVRAAVLARAPEWVTGWIVRATDGARPLR